MSAILFADIRLVANLKLNSMKKTVLIFSLIIGTILCVNMIVMVNMMYSNPDFKGNDLVGYAAMIVLFSLIFFWNQKLSEPAA